MLKWKVGDVTITRVVETDHVPYDQPRQFLPQADPTALLHMPWLFRHFVTPEGDLRVAVQSFLVETPKLRLVVDTCVGNDKPRRMTHGRPLATRFLQIMQAAGWPRESVQAVLSTHLHVDHVGWNTMLASGRFVPTFPRARYFIAESEYAYWKGQRDAAALDPEQDAIFRDSVQPLFDAHVVDLVATNERLAPEIRLLSTPGHTPGHVSVWIESRGEKAVITGDVLHHPCQIGRPDWSTVFDWDERAATETRCALLAIVANQPVLVLGTHFAAPTAGIVKRVAGEYRFER